MPLKFLLTIDFKILIKFGAKSVLILENFDVTKKTAFKNLPFIKHHNFTFYKKKKLVTSGLQGLILTKHYLTENTKKSQMKKKH